jgi:hypothetical protein
MFREPMEQAKFSFLNEAVTYLLPICELKKNFLFAKAMRSEKMVRIL